MEKQLTCSGCKWFDRMPARGDSREAGTCIVNPPVPVDGKKVAQYPFIFGTFKACGLYDIKTKEEAA